jgi:peptidoglycan/LPS O-acetylase OafA/YrhL
MSGDAIIIAALAVIVALAVIAVALVEWWIRR